MKFWHFQTPATKIRLSAGQILKALMVPVPKDTTIKKTIAEVAISLLGAEHIGPINACDYTLTSQIPKLTADKTVMGADLDRSGRYAPHVWCLRLSQNAGFS